MGKQTLGEPSEAHPSATFSIFPRVFNIFTGIEVTIFTIFWLLFLGLGGPYLPLLGPLLATPASSLTPSTYRNPISTQPKQNFDPKYFREL